MVKDYLKGIAGGAVGTQIAVNAVALGGIGSLVVGGFSFPPIGKQFIYF